jgi:Glycosyl hydrolase family 26
VRLAPRHLLALLLVASSAAATASPAAAAPIALGAYLPGSSENPAAIDAFARETGRRPVIVLTYKDWGSLPFSSTELDSIWRRGAVPMITWEPWTASGHYFPLRQIAAGRFDRYLRRAAGSAANWGKPIFVRFAQEMNGNWFPWGRGHAGNSPRDFRKAWKHLVDLFRFHGATNVKWVWSPNEDSGGSFPFGLLYPGDEWVDWVAIDGFDFGAWESWPSFTGVFDSTYDRLTALTRRPLMIAETGANEEGGDKAAWIASALGREAPRFSHLRALVWFDAQRPTGDFRVASSPGSLAAFREAVASPVYGTTRATLLSTPARLPGRAAAPAEPDGGYGAPTLLERVEHKLHGAYLVVVAALAGLVLVAIAALVVALLRRSRRTRAVA